MDAIMPVMTDPKKLVRRQMKMIVGIATRPDDPYPKRAERLKALRFCTDDVKFEVLKASDRVSEDLYDGLFALYFGEPIQESTDTMTDEQKERKITYLLTMLKDADEIERDGNSRQLAYWVKKQG